MTTTPPRCSRHEGADAIAVCAGCDADICGRCHEADRRGFAICPDCRTDRVPPVVPFEASGAWPTPQGFIHTALAALLGPRTFFAQFRSHHHWGYAAFFGMLCVTLGMVVNTLWQKAFSADYTDNLAAYTEQFGVTGAGVELLVFAALPVGSMVVYFVHTALFYLALRAFAIEGADWQAVARITGYSLAAYLMLIFPPIGEFGLGHFLMVLWLFNLEVSAIRSRFGVGFWKSIGVVLLPFVVFLFALS